jgi:hypothetical protein
MSLQRNLIKGFWFHLTKESFHRFFFDRTPFDRKVGWPNAIRPNTILPKGHLTETPFDRTPFDRMPFYQKFIWPNRRLTECRLTESSFYRKKSFGRKQNLSKSRWPKILFEKLVEWPKWNLTGSWFERPWFIIKIGKAILIFESASDQKRDNIKFSLIFKSLQFVTLIIFSTRLE